MSKTFRGGNVLWIILIIIALLSAGGLLFFMFQERSTRIETEQKLSEVEKIKQEQEVKLNRAQLQVIQLKDRAQLLAEEVGQEKRNYQRLLKDTEQNLAQAKELEEELAREKRQRESLAEALTELRQSRDEMEVHLKEARLNVQKLQKRLGKFTGKAGVELKKIVVKPKEELTGKVLVVNREFHFIVIDLGRKHGVKVGDEFLVYQDAQEIGRVQLEKVHDLMSTAAILSSSQEQKITEDSTIKSF